jgi:hypothetical protein
MRLRCGPSLKATPWTWSWPTLRELLETYPEALDGIWQVQGRDVMPGPSAHPENAPLKDQRRWSENGRVFGMRSSLQREVEQLQAATAPRCLTCGAILPEQAAGRPRLYCSRRCGRVYRQKQARAIDPLAWQCGMCPACGRQWMRPNIGARTTRRTELLCKSCRDLYEAQNIRRCLICDKELPRQVTGRPRQYCDTPECQRAGDTERHRWRRKEERRLDAFDREVRRQRRAEMLDVSQP